MDRALATGTPLWITIPGIGKVPARITGRAGERYACSFVDAVPHTLPGTDSFVTVVELRAFDPADAESLIAPIQRWPLPVRVAVAVALAAALWALILWWL